MSTLADEMMKKPKLLYSRELPGGGYVTIQSEPLADSTFRGWIAVERRTDRTRRDAHNVPVIAETEGLSADVVYSSLHKIASDNVALARHIRRWEMRETGGKI